MVEYWWDLKYDQDTMTWYEPKTQHEISIISVNDGANFDGIDIITQERRRIPEKWEEVIRNWTGFWHYMGRSPDGYNYQYFNRYSGKWVDVPRWFLDAPLVDIEQWEFLGENDIGNAYVFRNRVTGQKKMFTWDVEGQKYKVLTPDTWYLEGGAYEGKWTYTNNKLNWIDQKTGKVIPKGSLRDEYYQDIRKRFDIQVEKPGGFFSKSGFKGGVWVVAGVDSALFLIAYELEAVSFTEFIYYEGVRWGIKLLRMIRDGKHPYYLGYFAEKFLAGVWQSAYGFHVAYGPMNPFSVNGYQVMYETYWREFLIITGLSIEVPEE